MSTSHLMGWRVIPRLTLPVPAACASSTAQCRERTAQVQFTRSSLTACAAPRAHSFTTPKWPQLRERKCSLCLTLIFQNTWSALRRPLDFSRNLIEHFLFLLYSLDCVMRMCAKQALSSPELEDCYATTLGIHSLFSDMCDNHGLIVAGRLSPCYLLTFNKR